MIRGVKTYPITNEQLTKLIQLSEPQIFHVDQTIIYKGNIPNAAFCLINGTMQIRKYDNSLITIEKMILIGYEECLARKAFKHNLEVKSGSEILILPMSFLKREGIFDDILSIA